MRLKWSGPMDDESQLPGKAGTAKSRWRVPKGIIRRCDAVNFSVQRVAPGHLNGESFTNHKYANPVDIGQTYVEHT
jgi:hypothetical protein